MISTGVINANNTVTLTGTAPAGSTVTLSDGGSSAGHHDGDQQRRLELYNGGPVAWHYAFTATDTTSAGTSAASSPLM